MPRPKDPEGARLWSERQSAAHKKGNYLKKRWDDPEERKILLEARASAITPDLCELRKDTATKCWKDPDWVRRNIESRKKTFSDPDWKLWKGRVLKERFKDPELLKKLSDITTRAYQNPVERSYRIECRHGGFWYGAVRYFERTFYCEKWTRDFRNRCRAWDDYKSVLSGITKEQNLVKGKPTELSVHHVYYQKKACCEWDEDINGYYVMINLGTRAKPIMVRYDIKGDPNKFVTLSHAENVMVNYDKLKWIKLFEDMIEFRDGKCYYTKEEMKKLNE